LSVNAGLLFVCRQCVVFGFKIRFRNIQLFTDLCGVDEDVLDLLLRNVDVICRFVFLEILIQLGIGRRNALRDVRGVYGDVREIEFAVLSLIFV